MTRIQTERTERGWTRRKMAQKLRDAADPRDVPSLDSLMHNVYRWECGDRVSERYRILYCRVFNRSERELFGCGEPAYASDKFPVSASPVTDEDYDGFILVRLPCGTQGISVDVYISDEKPAADRNAERTARLAAVKSTGIRHAVHRSETG